MAPREVFPAVADAAAALAAIAARAAAADAGKAGLGPDLRALAEAGVLGLLSDPATPPVAQATLLRRIGRASLPVGRLAEGHMNALLLVALYGTDAQRQAHAAAAAAGTVYGVWGADGDDPVRLRPALGGRVRLSGSKRFASGLGVLGRAVVSAATADGPQLLLVRADEGDRADLSDWRTSGMRATASGTYTLDGIAAEPLGAPGDWLREPHFHGGVWRYAAVQLGGLEALAEAVRLALAARGDAAEPLQLHRLARLAILTHGARRMVEDAATEVAAPGAGRTAVALSLAAREAVETACLDGMALADRALGTQSFFEGHPVERIRRDLGFFLRQADLDGKLAEAGAALCAQGRPVGEVWGA